MHLKSSDNFLKHKLLLIQSLCFVIVLITATASAADLQSFLADIRTNGVRPIEIQDFPWTVRIVNKTTGKLFCGGSILSEFHVLTAGRCVHNWFNETNTQRIEPNSISVIAGNGKLMEDEGGKKEFDVLEIHVHSGFVFDESYKAQPSSQNNSNSQGSDDTGFQNDLAILVLSSRINFTEFIKPIKISGQLNPTAQEPLTIVSWGIIDKKQNSIPTGKNLKKFEIDYYLDAEKGGNFGLYPKGHTIQFNTGIRNNKGLMGQCIGDPGGAVLCEEIGQVNQDSKDTQITSKNYVLCGVVTFGIWCDRYYPTGRFTNMHFYEDWVNSIIGSTLWVYLTLGGILIVLFLIIVTFAIVKKRKNTYQV